MPHIRPIKDLRNTTEISDLCHSSFEPIFITKNGYGDMVIMSNETYEKEIALADVYKKLLIAQKQIDNKEVIDSDDVFAKMKDKYEYEL